MSSLLRVVQLASRVASRAHRVAQPLHAAAPVTSAANIVVNAAHPARWYNNAAQAAPATSAAGNSLANARATSGALDRSLLKLDAFVRRTGRVMAAELDDIIALAKKQERLTGSQTVLLLRATGGFLCEKSPKDRESLAEQIWQLVDRSQIDISHYNALLQVRLENGTAFDPLEILKELKEANMTPNRVTYQRLIQRFCDTGDIAGATKVLEFMKSEGLPVSERVFNALITGHLRAGDEAAARKMLDVMTSAQLPPSAETYTALACGLASSGKAAAAVDAIGQHPLSDEQVMRVIKALATSSGGGTSAEAFADLLAKLPHGPGFSQDLVNSCLELLALNKLDAALAVFRQLPALPNNNASGQFFIAQMVRCGMPVADVARVCRQWKDEGINDVGIKRAVEAALQTAERTTMLEYLELMQTDGHPIRVHFFLPAICKSANETEVFDTLGCMFKSNVPITDEYFLDYVVPRVNCESPDDVIAKMHELGYPLSVSVNALAKRFAMDKQIDACLSLVDRHDCQLRGAALAPLVGYATSADNVKTCVQLVKRFVERPLLSQRKSDLVGRYLLAVPREAIDSSVAAVAEAQLNISSGPFNQLASRGANVQPLAQNVVDYREESEVAPVPSEMSIEELESHIIELESKGMRTRGVVRKLLLNYCRSRQVDKVEQMLTKLENEGLSGAICASLTDMYVYVGNLDKALHYYEKVVEVDKFVLDHYKVVNLAALMIENGQLPKARELLEKHPFEDGGDALQRNAMRLVASTVDKYGVDEAMKIATEVVPKFTFVSSVILGPIMKKLIETDFSAALAFLKDVSARFKMTPFKREVCLRLINDQNDAELDNVMAISRDVHGEYNSQLDLASYYIEAKMPDKATQIMKMLPLNRTRPKIEAIFESFLDRKLIDEVESLGKIATQVGHDRDQVYYYLMRGYGRSGNIDRALDLWTNAQEDNAILSNRTLRYLARLLEQDGRPIPFVVPSEFEMSRGGQENNADKSQSRADSPFITVLKTSIDEAISFRDQLSKEGQTLNNFEESQLINTLCESDRLDEAFKITLEVLGRRDAHQLTTNQWPRPRVMRHLMSRLSRLGRVDDIITLRQLIPDDLVATLACDDYLCNAFVFAGRAGEYLDIIEAKPADQRFGYGGLHSILDNCPDLTDRVLAIGRRCARDGAFFGPINIAWMRLFISGDYAQADQLLAEFPELCERLMFNNVRQHVMRACDDAASERLMNVLVKSSPRAHGIGISTHVDVLVGNARVDDAHAVVQKAVAEGFDIANCDARSLENLRKELAMLGKEPAFTMPAKRGLEK